MQIYAMVSRCSRRQAASRIWYENFEQKSAAYTPVFTVVIIVSPFQSLSFNIVFVSPLQPLSLKIVICKPTQVSQL